MAVTPEERKVSAAALTQTIGSSGLKRYGGYILDDRPPKGERAWTDVFIKMQDEAIVGGLLAAFETLAGRVDWFWEAADDSPEAQANLQFVEECWDDMDQPWSDILSEIWTMLPFGWALLEQTYKQRRGPVYRDDGSYDNVQSSRFDDGRTGWAKWSLRGQETRQRWVFGADGAIEAMVQLAPPDFQIKTIPLEKCLLFRTTARKGNPEGRSILRAGYTSWYRMTRIQIVEGIGIERDLAGIPVAEVPAEILSPDATDADKQLAAAILSIVTNIKRDTNEGIVWPQEYDQNGNKLYTLSLLTTGGRRQFDTHQSIMRYAQFLLTSVMADFIIVGHESVGSYALLEEKSQLFANALEGYLDRIAAVINTYAVPRLLRLNGLPDDLAPKLEHGKVREIALDLMAKFLTALGAAGVPLDDPAVVERLLTLAQLPVPPDIGAAEEEEEMADVEDDVASAETASLKEGDAEDVPS